MKQVEVSIRALDGWDEMACKDVENIMPSTLFPTEQPINKCDNISLKSFVNYTEELGTAAHSPDFAWILGNKYDLNLLGDVGDAITSSRYLGTALRRLADGFVLLQDSTEMRLQIFGDTAQISYRILDSDIWPRHQDAMFTLGILGQLIQDAITDDWDDVEIAFEAEADQVRPPIRLVDGASISFGAETNYIRMPAHFLQCEMKNLKHFEAEYQHKYYTSQILSKTKSREMIDRVSDLIIRDLNSTKFCQNRIAKELGMSSRTLRRKLSEKGQSFQSLLDDCRMKQAALELKTRSHLSIAQIALRLGYSEHSTFTRAFCRWAGQPPQDYRKSMRIH